MKRKITWMCILALLANNIFLFNPAGVRAEEGSVDVPAQINEEAGDAGAEGEDERPEGVESVVVPTDAAQVPDERPEGVEPVTVPTDAAQIPDERPEGVVPVTVPTDAAQVPDERPEGVEPVTVPTDGTGGDSVSENEEEPVDETSKGQTISGDESVSDNGTVPENWTVSENGTVSDDETGVVSENEAEKKPERVFSVEMPTSQEGRSSFDYVLDPDGLIEKTGAKHYGGREYQKGANLFFVNNRDMGDGTVSDCFSDTSEKKTLVNRSTMPVSVNVQVKLIWPESGNSVTRICEDPSFEETDQPAIAFSLKDGDEKEILMDEKGEITAETVLEEEGEYSFVITGKANKNADWSSITQGPGLEVSWTVKPVEEEADEEETDEKDTDDEDKDEENKDEEAGGESEESTSENGISENDVPENDVSENEAEAEPDADGEGPSLSGSESGRCIFEGVAENGPYSVILPAGHEDMYSFIMDPQRLIEASEGAAHPGKTFEEGKTLYFRNTVSDAAYDFSSRSDMQRIINNGSRPLKVSVSVSIASKEKFSLSPVEDFDGYKGSHIYISIVSGNGNKLDDITYLKDGVKAETVISPADVDTFEIDWSEERGYFRVPVSEEDGKEVALPEFDFRITGSTNEKANWNRLKKGKVKLNVVWSVEEADNPEMEQEETGEE